MPIDPAWVTTAYQSHAKAYTTNHILAIVKCWLMVSRMQFYCLLWDLFRHFCNLKHSEHIRQQVPACAATVAAPEHDSKRRQVKHSSHWVPLQVCLLSVLWDWKVLLSSVRRQTLKPWFIYSVSNRRAWIRACGTVAKKFSNWSCQWLWINDSWFF